MRIVAKEAVYHKLVFEARYEQHLGEGAELEVHNAREGWLKVLAGGKYEGWLPAQDVALW